MTDVAKVAAGLINLECERLTGWQGPRGAMIAEREAT